MLRMLKKAYSNNVMEKTAVYQVHKGFHEGRTKIHFFKSVMLEVFFNYKDVKFISEGKTVNIELYLEILNDFEMESDKNYLQKNEQQTIGFFYTTMLHHILL